MRRNGRSFSEVLRSESKPFVPRGSSRGPASVRGGWMVLFDAEATEGHQTLTVGVPGLGSAGREGPAAPLGRRVRAPAGRLLPSRGGAGNGAFSGRSSAGGASAALLKDWLEAGLVEGSTGVRHLLRWPFNVCSCCPAPCSLMTQRSSPGYRSASNSGCSLTFVFDYLPGSREKLDEIGCLPWELPHVTPHSTWVLPSLAIIPQGTTDSCRFL